MPTCPPWNRPRTGSHSSTADDPLPKAAWHVPHAPSGSLDEAAFDQWQNAAPCLDEKPTECCRPPGTPAPNAGNPLHPDAWQ
eukprot:scaffold826_cov335-Pavlova_lutheri.AAC.12